MYLVFDVGGTYIKYAWMSGDGEILEKHKTPTPIKPEDNMETFLSVLVDVYRKYKQMGEVDGIAMSLPGQIDVENGIVYGGGALKYTHLAHLGEMLSERCDHVRVSMENDGKCAALAELWKGNAKDATNACVLIVGTGIGGGIIIDRKVHRGKRMLAGELSYCIENMNRKDIDNIFHIEEIKTLGETFDQMPFLSASQQTAAALTYHASVKKGLSHGDVTGEWIYQMVEQGDSELAEILEEMYFSIAKMCMNLYVTVDPDVILIGGGISAQPAFVEGIKKYVEKLKEITLVYSEIKVDICKFRNDSNLLGALYNFKQMYQ